MDRDVSEGDLTDAKAVDMTEMSVETPSPIEESVAAEIGRDGASTSVISPRSTDTNASPSVPPAEEVLVDDYGFIYKKGTASDQMAGKISDHLHFTQIKNLGAYRKLENQWVGIISNWSQYSDEKYHNKIKNLCRLGIPESVRGRAWQLLAGSIELTKEGLYEDLKRREELPIYEVIKRDINRCYPDHSLYVLILMVCGVCTYIYSFREETSQGQRDLFDILKAYAHYNPEIGYCQGMGRVVGMMLMQIPAEETFWLLAATIQKHLRGYYTAGLDRLRMHAMVFEKLLHKHVPRLAKHLEKNDVVPLIYMTQWFLTLYTMVLPWPSVLRVWDMFYSDGIKVLFRIGLAIMFQIKDHLLKSCPTSTEILEFLLHIPFNYLEADRIMRMALSINIGRREVELLEAEATKRWNDAGSPTRGTLSMMK